MVVYVITSMFVVIWFSMKEKGFNTCFVKYIFFENYFSGLHHFKEHSVTFIFILTFLSLL